jgi:hypothetical protein
MGNVPLVLLDAGVVKAPSPNLHQNAVRYRQITGHVSLRNLRFLQVVAISAFARRIVILMEALFAD